ncbi:MAG: hypothetical protein PSX81_07645 [bacterium]|nr:hypothetical protein [bacterium]
MTTTNKIDGFEWHLPLAYRDSISQCKFEQGDIIYKHQLPDKTWGDQKPDIDFMLQVKSPTRTITTAKEELDVFASNWDSKIIFEMNYPNNPSSNKVIETTQGKFFTFIWKNDDSVFSDDRQILPALTSSRLRPVKPKPKKNDPDPDDLKTNGWLNVEFITSMVPLGFSGFALIVDTVSDLMTGKRNVVADILTNQFNSTSKIFDCVKAITLDEKQQLPSLGFTPTLSVELFLFHSKDVALIKEELKKVLFKQKKERGVFSISNHGLFIEN